MKATDKTIDKDKEYKYTFTANIPNINCTVEGGSAKIWIHGTEKNANTYTKTNVATSGTFEPTQKTDTTTSWTLHLKGVGNNNTVTVNAPDNGTWT